MQLATTAAFVVGSEVTSEVQSLGLLTYQIH